MNPAELLALSSESAYDHLDLLVDTDPIGLRDTAWKLLAALRNAQENK